MTTWRATYLAEKRRTRTHQGQRLRGGATTRAVDEAEESGSGDRAVRSSSSSGGGARAAGARRANGQALGAGRAVRATGHADGGASGAFGDFGGDGAGGMSTCAAGRVESSMGPGVGGREGGKVGGMR